MLQSPYGYGIVLTYTKSNSPAVPVVAELGLCATLLFADHAAAAERDVASDPVVWHGAAGSAVAHHNLLAVKELVSFLEAAFADTQAAAVAESALEDVLSAHAAVGGLPEEVCVVPVMLALPKDISDQHLPPGPLEAAPQGEEHRQEHGAQSPDHQTVVCDDRGGSAAPAPRPFHPSAAQPRRPNPSQRSGRRQGQPGNGPLVQEANAQPHQTCFNPH